MDFTLQQSQSGPATNCCTTSLRTLFALYAGAVSVATNRAAEFGSRTHGTVCRGRTKFLANDLYLGRINWIRVVVARIDPAIRSSTADTAAATETARAADTTLACAWVGWTSQRVTTLRRTFSRLMLDAAIGAVSVEALAARFTVLSQAPGLRTLVLALPLAVLVAAAIFPALFV
jgi:hypothetical protein